MFIFLLFYAYEENNEIMFCFGFTFKIPIKCLWKLTTGIAPLKMSMTSFLSSIFLHKGHNAHLTSNRIKVKQWKLFKIGYSFIFGQTDNTKALFKNVNIGLLFTKIAFMTR